MIVEDGEVSSCTSVLSGVPQGCFEDVNPVTWAYLG